MDRLRRQLFLSLALAPGMASLGLSHAAADTTATEAPSSEAGTITLEARDAAADGTPRPTALSYGEASQIPIFRVRPGVATHVRLINRMAEPTSLQWHGMRLPNALDGVPGIVDSATAPGAASDIVLTPRDSGTAWFHPGAMPGIADQTARGLVGILIVEETAAPPVDADRVLVLTDRLTPDPARSVAATGAVRMGADLPQSLWVNRKAWPQSLTLPPRARLRLRIVNASTRRALAAGFEGGRPYVIAIDGQPSELFEPLSDTVPVGPGARFDLMIDLPTEPDAEVRLRLREADTKDAGSVALVLRTAGAAAPDKPPIAPLPANPTLPPAIPLEASTRANLKVALGGAPPNGHGRWSVNGVQSEALSQQPLFSVRRNAPVTLGFSNKSKVLTAFRLHGHVMRLLHALDDGWEPYWRDSVIVPPGVTHHVAFLADNPGRWLIESPFADQAAHGLRSWFEVLG